MHACTLPFDGPASAIVGSMSDTQFPSCLQLPIDVRLQQTHTHTHDRKIIDLCLKLFWCSWIHLTRMQTFSELYSFSFVCSAHEHVKFAYLIFVSLLED